METRTAKLTEMGDSFGELNARIGREAFRAGLPRVHNKVLRSNAQRCCVHVKILVLQQLHNYSDNLIHTQYATDCPACAFLVCNRMSR